MLAYYVDLGTLRADYADVADEVERGGRGGDSGDGSSGAGLCPPFPGPTHVAEGQEGDLGSKSVHVALRASY